jgi:hypothetical protein
MPLAYLTRKMERAGAQAAWLVVAMEAASALHAPALLRHPAVEQCAIAAAVDAWYEGALSIGPQFAQDLAFPCTLLPIVGIEC